MDTYYYQRICSITHIFTCCRLELAKCLWNIGKLINLMTCVFSCREKLYYVRKVRLFSIFILLLPPNNWFLHVTYYMQSPPPINLLNGNLLDTKSCDVNVIAQKLFLNKYFETHFAKLVWHDIKELVTTVASVRCSTQMQLHF